MANQQHLDMLQQNISIWNSWRKEHIQTRPDLSEANLSRANLSEVNLSRANLSEANLSEANLSRANLSEASLNEANLNKANLSGASLILANLGGATLTRADLSTSDLIEASLIRTDLEGALLIGANLIGVKIIRANFSRTNFSRANLSGVDLSGADLSGVVLSGANLSRANLSRASLDKADLNVTNLSRANLSETNLIRAILSRTNLSKAKFALTRVGWTIFGGIDLQPAEGLETVQHSGPSTIGIDTLILSKGNIPETFLRGAGIPETFIAYTRSLVANPVEYYTCFISYSSQDQAFAERLYTDLQSKGVRCWFAPEDLKIGDKFHQRIDESIRFYDKLLLILSKNSVASPWVEKEVEAAFEKEHYQKKLVLFPIKLDEVVMKTDQAWAADIRRTRHIGNFCNWKLHDDYQRAFMRLLRDLQPKKG